MTKKRSRTYVDQWAGKFVTAGAVEIEQALRVESGRSGPVRVLSPDEIRKLEAEMNRKACK